MLWTGEQDVIEAEISNLISFGGGGCSELA